MPDPRGRGKAQCRRRGRVRGRLGGDEFALITPDSVQPARLAAFAERILASMTEGFEVAGQRLHIGLSIGVAIHPDDGADATALFANANAALYRAKEEGRGLARFFEPGMDTRLRERRALQQDLRSGIERGEILLHYQPQSTIEGDIVARGAGALAPPERGLIRLPPYPDRRGKRPHRPLGEWILREAAREAHPAAARADRVNLSRSSSSTAISSRPCTRSAFDRPRASGPSLRSPKAC